MLYTILMAASLHGRAIWRSNFKTRCGKNCSTIYGKQYFSHRSLQTIDGDDLVVVKPGQENLSAGLYFLNAYIQLNKTLRVGQLPP